MSGNVTAEVPVEMLFTEMITEEEIQTIPNFTVEWYEHHQQTANLPIARLTPHKNLMRYLMNEPARLEIYLSWYRLIHTTRRLAPPLTDSELLEYRRKQFRFMRKALAERNDYFERHSPLVKFNRESGFFNLKDGHHRTVFLYLYGSRRIAVQMSSEDYLDCMNVTQSLITRL